MISIFLLGDLFVDFFWVLGFLFFFFGGGGRGGGSWVFRVLGGGILGFFGLF